MENRKKKYIYRSIDMVVLLLILVVVVILLNSVVVDSSGIYVVGYDSSPGRFSMENRKKKFK
jgi:hypothetical protein